MKIGINASIIRSQNFSDSLKSVIPSTVADWDATQFASYSGTGQLWNNLVSIPNDGSTQSAYHMALGLNTTPSTDDPTFIGTAGTPSAYWTNDGGDRFTLNGANTTFLNALHKTTGGTSFWIALAFRYGDFVATSLMFGTNAAITTLGMGVRVNSAELTTLGQGDGTTSKILSSPSPTGTIGADTILIFSYNGATVRRWINSLTKTENANTLQIATADAGSILALFVNAPTDARFYAAAIGNAFIDDADATLIAGTYFNRHQRGYGLFPENTVAPAISGTQIVGSVLTTTTGTWLNSPSFTYQWRRNGVNIASATASTYTLVTQDLGAAITCAVTGTANGKSLLALSNTLSIANNLSAVVAGAVFQHDATFAASYDGSSQTWANVISTPADGSGQTAYDMVLGTTSSPQTNDPTFVGVAGNSASYFSNDGGDLFTLLSGTNTTLLDNLHKTTPTTPFTMICAFNTADQTGSVNIFATTTTTTALGIRMSVTSVENVTLTQNDGTSAVVLTGGTTANIGTPTLAIYSWDGTTGRRWLNTRTGSSATPTPNVTTSSASAALVMFRSMASGSQFYGSGLLNAAISLDAEASRIFDAYNLWHNRTYA